MTMIGVGPVFDMMRKEAAKQRAREDHAYEKERRRLADADAEVGETLKAMGKQCVGGE